MIDRSDFTTGERVKVGARVDKGVYRAFRNWVEAQTGKQYAEVGRALERAMLEYMDDDRLADELSDLSAQTAKNEALLRQVLTAVESEAGEKEKGKTGNYAVEAPTGKSPGDRQGRELAVIAALYQMPGEKFTKDTIAEAIRDVAGVSSDRTVQSYIESITDTQAFLSTGAVGVWRFDRPAAADLLKRNGQDVPEVAVDD